MDKSTLDAISSALSYLSTPVGSGSVIVDASKGQVFSAALGTTQTLVSFGEMMGKRLPIAGSALAYSALGRDFLNMKTTIDDSGEVHVSDIYSVFADLSAIVASATLAAAVGAASAPALIATAVVITAAGAVLTVMAMNSGDESIDLNPYIDSLSNALHGLGEVLGEAYTSAIESFQDAMEATGDFAQAFNDYVVGALDDITDAVSSSIFNFTDLIVENLRDAYDAALNTVSPLILDLDGDGVETLSLSSGVYFDHDGNGFAESTGWVGKDDGLLIWDRNGNGQIDDGSELFGNYTHLTNGQIATNGFSVLADLDSNHDGKIDANDSAFGQLGVWKDSNSDAKLDEGELLSLGEANVQSLSVGYVDENTTDSQGNKVLQSGTYTDSSGASHDLDDVWFVVDTARTVDLNKIVLGEQTASSIDLDGFGNVADLSQAILRDTTGHLKHLVEQFAVETDTTKRYSLLDQIIFSWSGAAAYTSVSRGGYIDDGRKLYALEAFSGQGFIQSAGINVGTGNPGPNAAAKLMQAYGQLAGFLYSGLMLQTHFRPLVEAIDLGFENYELKFDVARLVEMLRFAYDEDSALGAQEMSGFSKALLDSGVQGGAILTNLRQAGDVNVPGFDCLLANMGYSLGGLINDELYGDSHNNALFGLAGRDTLYGDAGNDILDGGADDDYLSGDEGSDIYRFSRGWGHDTLNNFDSGDNKVDFIEFASDIAPSEIGVTRSGDDLVLVLRGGADRIKVVNYFYSDGASDYYLEEIRFADGAIWRLEQIKAMVGITTPGDDEIHGYASSDNLSGGLGNDKLFGAQGDDVLNGGGGNDYLEGGTGSDVYHFNLGDGRDVINEDVENLGDSDVLYFGEGISPADINVSIQGSSLLLQHGNGHDQVVFLNWFIQLGSRYQVERIEFADGTVWMSSELTSSLLNRTGTEFDDVITGASSRVSQTFLGGGGNDNLTTGAGDDQLEGGTGNDILNGAAGSDIYLFNVGDGQDVINDDNISYYYGGVDVLRFGTGIQVSDIMASRSGTSLVLSHINGQDQVTVTNWFTENTGRYQLERIEFADGTMWTSAALSAQLLQLTGGVGDDVLTGIGAAFKQVLSGGGGNDTLTAGSGDDQLAGGTGNDTLNGGQGSDLYLFSLGDGRDVINDDNLSYMYGGVDVLRFGTGIQAADILASRSGTSLVLSHVNGQDQVTVTNWFTENTDRYQLERIEFADGTVWTSAALSVQVLQLTGGAGDDVLTGVSSSQAQVIRGGGGNDTLTAGAGADQLEGGTGNDTLNGGQGSDLYLFNLGDGRDVINDDNLSYMYGGVDVLRFGTGIQAADIIASRSGTSLVLSHVNGQDQITVTNWFAENTGRYQLERIEFADGTVWTSTTLSAQLLQLTGGAGDDVLVGIGAAFKQVLSGGGGNDTLTAGSGDDQLAGGTGNDTLNGGQGSDIYLFNLGDGRDVINDDNLSYMYGGVDILRFGMGIQASDIVASRSGTSLVLSHANGQDQVTVTNWFTENTDRYQLERIEFTDGTVWTSATLSAQMLQLTGGAGDDVLTGVSSSQSQVIRGGGGNDTLTAGSGNDLLEGGTGNDTLNGGQGSDLYLFSLGDGRDVINDDNISYYYGGVDVLRFGTGIQASDISASRSGTSLVLSHANGQDQVTVTNWFTENTGRYQLERIEFADGTVWTSAALSAQLLQLTGGAGDDVLTGIGAAFKQVLSGGGGNDTLTAGTGDDQLEGGTGNDTLNGGAGSDTYLFKLGDGRDVINDDNISYYYGGVDILRFGAGIQASDISASRSGTSLVLSHVNGQDQVTVTNWFTENTGRYQLERIEFADGTVWTSAALSAQLLQLTGGAGDDVLTGIGAAFKQVLSGGGGNDTLTAGTGDDQLEGGTGNDTLNGGAGSDTYLFKLGDGRDVINDDNISYYYGGVDILRFGAGIQASDISASRSGTSLVLSHANGQDQVTVTNWFTENTGRYQLERIEFADGTVWTSAALSAQLLQLIGSAGDDVLTGVSAAFKQVISGGAGNDTLTAGSGDDQLEGGTGNDTLNGGAGSDTYVFNLGDGRDVINDDNISYYYGGVDILRFGVGIQASDISASRSGTSLVLSHINGQDQVTLNNWFTENSGRYQLERVEFADGAFWNASQVASRVSTSGNDTIIGSSTNDLLQGGQGNDLLQGGEGSDTYIFVAGDGQDIINNDSATPNDMDTLSISGITPQNLWLSRDGNNLVIDARGTDDRITVKDWYVSAAQKIDVIQTGSTALYANAVDNLVNAMASFGDPAGGEINLTQEQRDQVNVVIATNWQ